MSIALLLFSFVLLWLGSGIVVSMVEKIAHSLHMSSFVVSFFMLGLLTSLAEIMVGISAHLSKQPEIFVGNLVGGSIVIFLFIIPLLAVMGNGVSLNHSFRFKDLVSAAFVVGFPALFTLDNEITFIDAVACIGVYVYFLYMQQKNNHTFNRLVFINFRNYSLYTYAAKIIGAMALIFIASSILVSQTQELGTMLNISPYIVSMLVISLGTNIPEISIAARAIYSKNQTIAFGNYLGSASLNTFVLGVLAVLGKETIPADGSNYSIVLYLVGLTLFVYFGKSKNLISRNEGAVLMSAYILFVVFELMTGPGWVL